LQDEQKYLLYKVDIYNVLGAPLPDNWLSITWQAINIAISKANFLMM
jgi:hypothetical protein